MKEGSIRKKTSVYGTAGTVPKRKSQAPKSSSLLSVYILLLLLLWLQRAFGEPPKRALLYWNKHFRTDELLGAWLLLFGTVPAVPYTLVFFLIDPSFTYLGRHK